MATAKEHWENVYTTKQPHEVSWTQDVPQPSLDFIHDLQLPKTAGIIDVGGGDSKLVDFLLAEGFEHLTVLDISAKALERAKERLGSAAGSVHWVAQDITAFASPAPFDLWHDRATFHFLTTEEQINQYLTVLQQHVKPGGYAIIGTFSTQGPKKCSGLPIQQYSEATLPALLNNSFEKIRCITQDHITPFDTQQSFIFCLFKRRNDHK